MYTDKLTQLLDSKQLTKLICEQLILPKCEIPQDRLQKWSADLNEDIDRKDWLDNFDNINIASASTKIRSLIINYK